MIRPFKYRAKIAIMTGVYQKINIFGRPARTLECVVDNIECAEKWIEDAIREKPFYTRADFMIEDVEVKMKAWQP